MNNYIDSMVSVIMPVYNSEKYISKALQSVISQRYSNLEIIVVDDCSTDKSSEIISEFVEHNSNIAYYKLKRNSGVAYARNYGIRKARGRFLAFLDSDDIWGKEKLREQLKVFDFHKGCPMAYTPIIIIDENGNIIKSKKELKSLVSYKYLLKNTMIATSTVILDRYVVQHTEMPNRKSAEDYSLWLSVLKEYGSAYCCQKAVTFYRKSSTSLSSNKLREIKYFYQVQVEDMGLNKIIVVVNTFCYIVNALKKHYL